MMLLIENVILDKYHRIEKCISLSENSPRKRAKNLNILFNPIKKSKYIRFPKKYLRKYRHFTIDTLVKFVLTTLATITAAKTTNKS